METKHIIGHILQALYNMSLLNGLRIAAGSQHHIKGTLRGNGQFFRLQLSAGDL